jgi:general secretion pathway protein A
LPFSIAPDPSYLYMSEGHREALSHLLYGIRGDGGFILLTGEVGAGKTTLCRCLLEQVPPETDIAFVLNPRLSAEELLATICDDLGIVYAAHNATVKTYVDAINLYLLEAHARDRHTIVIIEEAQNLSLDVLEQLRLLTNLETDKCKLLQIILIGQPELLDIVSRPELKQLAQRITARYHLGALQKSEVPQYIAHRLSVAGGQPCIFPSSLIGLIHSYTGGIPRLINLLCDRALLGVYAEGKERADASVVRKAAEEVFGRKRFPARPMMLSRWALTGIFAALCSIAFSGNLNTNSEALQTRKSVPAVVSSLNGSPDTGKDQGLFNSMKDISAEESRGHAYRELFGLWNLSFSGGIASDPCASAIENGMQCLSGKGDLVVLKQLNKPVVLHLRNNLSALLRSNNGDKAVIHTVRGTRQISLNELADIWTGDYTALVRMPLKHSGTIHQGTRGEIVQLVERHISLIKGRSERRAVDHYDAFLESEIRNFQMLEGLVPDGIVGPDTIMHLNTAVVSRDPVLRSGEKGI